MKIELKSIKFSEAMSEETNAFTADLFINGKKVGYCKNNGQGGCTDYNSYEPELIPIIKEAEAYCKTLPDINYSGSFVIKNNLEHTINELLENWLKAKSIVKERKRMEMLMQTAILTGNPNTKTYSYRAFQTALVNIPTKHLQEAVERIKAKDCTNGEVILNTNLKALGISI